MEWPTVLMVIVGIVFASVVFYQLFLAGETVGSVSGYYTAFTGGERNVRLTVKRIAPSKSRRNPIVILRFGVFMGASSTHLNAIEAKRMADALDELVDRKIPTVTQFRGLKLELIPGEIGVTMDMGTDSTHIVTAQLDRDDAHQLAKMLRTAAAA